MNNDQLVEAAQAEMCELFSGTAREDMTAQSVFHENHAALLLAPGAAQLRPLQQSPIQNLFVTGAWTDTGWPANLESALVSARRCAELAAAHPA